MRKPSSIKLSFKILGTGIEGIWTVNQNEKQAAWELYVELSTRVVTNDIEMYNSDPLQALDSIYSLFDINRQLLKKYGPSLVNERSGEEMSLAYISIAILNKVLRPFLSKWNTMIRNVGKGYSSENELVKEEVHKRHEHFYEELKVIQNKLRQYNELLAKACGASNLHKKLEELNK